MRCYPQVRPRTVKNAYPFCGRSHAGKGFNRSSHSLKAALMEA
jgi:hypothetical protein